MRKTTKTVTEIVHEHGVISFELPLYKRLLEIANADNVSSEQVAAIYDKTVKISEEIDGHALSINHLPMIISGIVAV